MGLFLVFVTDYFEGIGQIFFFLPRCPQAFLQGNRYALSEDDRF